MVVVMRLHRAVLWLLAGLPLVGCGGGDAQLPGGKSPGTPASIKHRSVESLPKIGEYLPPLDLQRVEIAPPADWKSAPISGNFEAWFVPGEPGELPRITLAAGDSPLDAVQDLTVENAEALATQLLKELEHDKKTVAEPPRPIKLGSTLFLRSVRLAKMPSGANVVVQALETVCGGRLYSVELIAKIEAAQADQYEPSLKKWRDFGYAVAANLKFSGAGTQPADAPVQPSPPAETAPSEKTGVKNPRLQCRPRKMLVNFFDRRASPRRVA